MTDTLRRKAEQIFQKVADLPPERWSAFLDEHCRSEDPAIRADVESLLEHMESEKVASLHAEAGAPEGDAHAVGGMVGPYKLLQLIGEGGFGAVYMAEQEQPVRRRVALKIIKLGMDTKQVIARFEAERQALALMEHPNIAKVLDAGATDTGRPYFVMELVKGIPVTEYCDCNSLTTRQRLELFISICRAVQHAHQKGIIHRDIKPSNVLVTLHDGVPVPKVIDFGIAKATSQRLTEKTLFTEFLQFIGTPQYMSPEQAEMSGLDVDTRTDIYSLGVLMYELLTGTTPFDAKTLRRAALGEIQRIIREEDPPTPSRRLSTMGAQVAEIAKVRCAEAKTLSRLMRGDLDWIVMRSLEKDRTRRYETAAALADDIQYHLNNEPVMAGPPGRGYKVRKFIRRHQVGVFAGSMIAVALLIGLALATYGFIEARQERDRAWSAEQVAKQQAEKARTEAESAKAINAFFNDMLTSVDPMQVRLLSAFAPDERLASWASGGFPRDVSLAEMVRQAAAELGEAFDGKQELEAASRETIGMTLRGLGLFSDAEPQLRSALEIRRRTLGDNHPDTLRSALALGDLVLEAGKGAEAEPLVRAAYDGMCEVHGCDNAKTLCCAAILAQVLSDQGKYKEAEKFFRETLGTQLRILGLEHRDTLSTMWRQSVSYLSQWELTEGEALARKLHDVAAKTLGPDDSLNILSKPLLGWWYLARYEYEKAEAVFRPGLEQCRRILGPEHPVTYMTLHGLARSLQGAGVQDKKERLHREALAGLRATRGRLHWHTISTTADFAGWLDRRGKFAEAEQLMRALVADCARSLGEEHSKTLGAMFELAAFLERVGKFDEAVGVLREILATTQRSGKRKLSGDLQGEIDALTRALIRMGRIDEARLETQKLLAGLRANAEKNGKEPLAHNNYAWALLICVPVDLRDVDQALPFAEKAVKLSDGKNSAILDTLALAHHLAGNNDKAVKLQKRSLELLPLERRGELIYSANLVRYLQTRGDVAAADRVILEGVDMFRESLGEDNPTLAIRFNKAGLQLTQPGDYALAERILSEALELNRKVLGDGHEQVATTLKHLADVYHLLGDCDRADPAYREALSIFRSLLGDDDVTVADTMYALAANLHHGDHPEAAAEMMGKVLEVYERLDAGKIPAALVCKRHLAQVLTELGEFDRAEPLAVEALTMTRKLFGDEHIRTAQAMITRGLLMVETGHAAKAEPLLRECTELHDRLELDKAQAWLLAEAQGALGYCLVSLKRFEEAEPLLLECFTTVEAAKGGSFFGTRLARERLATLYQAWGKPDEAARWVARAPAEQTSAQRGSKNSTDGQ